jgi:SAM-dependent methyltransferase
LHNILHCPICDFDQSVSIDGYDNKPRPEVYKLLGVPSVRSRWNICKNCGFLFQNPRPHPESITRLYASGLYRSGKQYSEEFFALRYSRPLFHLSWAKKKSTLPNNYILDVGAGYGGAVRAFKDNGYNAEGIEPDRNLCAVAEKKFGVKLLNGKIEDIDFPPNSFGLIYSSHVHEHFNDFAAINSKIHSWLVPGGVLLCVLPTYRFSAKNGQGFINVFHNSIFTRTSLHNMFVKCGLVPGAFHYPAGHSLAEVWGMAIKPLSPLQKVDFLRDNWRFVLWEIKNSPVLFEIAYRIAEPVYHALKKGARWIHRTS